VLQNDQAAAYNNLGCLYQEMKQYQKAIEHHRESLTMRRQVHILALSFIDYISSGKCILRNQL